MKKLFSVAILDALLMLTPAQPAQAALGDTLLRVGSTGSGVIQLQRELKELGYNVGPIDRIFGSKTFSAVKVFQSSQSLRVDGIVGPIKVGKLESLYSTRLGSKQRLPLDKRRRKPLLQQPRKYIGVPYLWGGTSPETGFDCSTFNNKLIQ